MVKPSTWASKLLSALSIIVMLICVIIIYSFIYNENKTCIENGGVYVKTLTWFECLNR